MSKSSSLHHRACGLPFPGLVDREMRFPRGPVEKQDKRAVVHIELGDVERWLFGTPAEAADVVRLAPAEVFDGQPAPVAPKTADAAAAKPGQADLP